MTTSALAAHAQARELRLPPLKLLIDGDWRDAVSGATFATIDPATEQVIAEIPEPGEQDVDHAVMAARRAFDEGPWPAMRAAERSRVLRRLAGLLERHHDEIVEIESLDAGKPLAAVRRQDFPAVLDCLEYYAGWCDKITGDVVPVRPTALTYVVRAPVGVVAGIVPWNFPLMNAMWKIAPALACGCTMVLKPAAETPLSALFLGELALEAGIPNGVLNVLPGPGPTAGSALVSHPRIDKITFTGSPGVGKLIMERAAQHVPKITLELGGKSPNIVFADADLDAAIKAATAGVFFNAGQVCSAGTRLLVEDAVYEEVAERLIERAGSLKVGDPRQEDTYVGPLISERQLSRVLGYVERGVAEGANLETGGSRLDCPGYFVPPTVFTDVDNSMVIAREEIFGPVVSLIRFDGEDEAVRIANDSPYSLAAGLWTVDVRRAHAVAHRLRAGMVWVNTYGQTDTRLPWGGLGGDSGVGRDLGETALENYTDRRAIWVNLRSPR
ncbi:MAG TPA: aldehyde dehydrogenase family protein [Acidimicrobiales bacterium]|nr:aldehyde dehydrogenase family protein [Acidimicrobiales bacterium]